MSGNAIVRALSLRIAPVAMAALAMIMPARAQAPSVDELLARALAPQHFALAPEHKIPYELTADFNATLSVEIHGSLLRADAAGLFQEWQGVNEPTIHHRVRIQQLHLPLLLRPFGGFLRHEVEARVERLSSDSPDFHAHDFFIADTQAGNLYVVAGIHHAIVSEAMDRFNAPSSERDPMTRRLVARWLYTSPLMRTWIVRSGPPYALEATLDDAGLVHALAAFYDWGRTSTTITYGRLNGEPIWTHVISDIDGEIPRVGAVHGRFTLAFTNYWRGGN